MIHGDRNPIIPEELLDPKKLFPFLCWLQALDLSPEEDKRALFDWARDVKRGLSAVELNAYFTLRGTDVP